MDSPTFLEPYRYFDLRVGIGVLLLIVTVCVGESKVCYEGYSLIKDICCKNRECDRGHEVTCPADDPEGSFCQRCPDGFFNDIKVLDPKTDKCRQRRTCDGDNMIYKTRGNSTSNAQCGCERGYELTGVHCRPSQKPDPDQTTNPTTVINEPSGASDVTIALCSVATVLLIILVVVVSGYVIYTKQRAVKDVSAMATPYRYTSVSTLLAWEEWSTDGKRQAQKLMVDEVSDNLSPANISALVRELFQDGKNTAESLLADGRDEPAKEQIRRAMEKWRLRNESPDQLIQHLNNIGERSLADLIRKMIKNIAPATSSPTTGQIPAS